MFLGLPATTAEMDCCHNWKHMLFQVERHSFCNALGLVLICTALGLLHCDAVQVTMNTKDILFIETIGPIWRGSLHFHFVVTHWYNHCFRHTKLFFDNSQVASCLQAAKQQSRHLCGPANTTTVHTLLWIWNYNRGFGWFHPTPFTNQCHCMHPGCPFAWLASTSAFQGATWTRLNLGKYRLSFETEKKLRN